MTLSVGDAKELYNYFFCAGSMLRSVQGPILDRMVLMNIKHAPASGPITARPTKEIREEHTAEIDEDGLELFGRVSRKLAMVTHKQRQVLEVFHGDDGACCAERVKLGRIVSLFRFTAAGRSLVGRERQLAGKLKVTNMELIQNAVSRAQALAMTGKDSFIALATAQAHSLKEDAESAYTAAGWALQASRRKPDRPRFVRLVGDDE